MQVQFAEFSKECAGLWKDMSGDDKAKYVKQAEGRPQALPARDGLLQPSWWRWSCSEEKEEEERPKNAEKINVGAARRHWGVAYRHALWLHF